MGLDLSKGRDLVTDGYGLEADDLPSIDDGPVDPRAWFGAPGHPFEIEIGPGKGTFLVQQAPLAAGTNFLGIEWARGFWRYAADRVRRRGLENVRLLRANATEFIRWRCPDGIVAVIHLYFSDPWPKKRHHKRRVIQERSVRDMHRVLAIGGEIRLVTDHDGLWAWYEERAASLAELFERIVFEATDSAGCDEIVGSNYERKFAVEGRPFHAMTLKKRP